MSTQDGDDIDVQTETMARVIFDGYAELIDLPDRWRDDHISDETRAKYRLIADDVLDRIQWRRFGLARGTER